MLHRPIGNEALIHTAQRIHESLQNAFGFDYDPRKLLQRTTTRELACVVNDRLNAKHALAFGIDLQSQLAAVQLEDRQIIRRFLDRYFPFG